MPKIISTAISFAEYRVESKELDLTFKQGKTYTFFEVPEKIYLAFLSSDSQGAFFHEHIRDVYRKST
jgi:hypothetical protein